MKHLCCGTCLIRNDEQKHVPGRLAFQILLVDDQLMMVEVDGR